MIDPKNSAYAKRIREPKYEQQFTPTSISVLDSKDEVSY